MESKAFDKSINTAPTNLLQSKDFQFSIKQVNALFEL